MVLTIPTHPQDNRTTMKAKVLTLSFALLWWESILVFALPPRTLPLHGSLATRPHISLKDSVFREIEDYTAWTQYLCTLILRADDMDRLEEATFRLHQLIALLSKPQQAPVQREYTRLVTIINNRRQQDPWLHQPVDPVADAIFSDLMKGHFEQAKKEIREIVGGADYREMTDPMKTVMIVEGLVLLDGLDAYMMLPLWSPSWKLNKDEKISAIMRAKSLIVAARQGELDPTLQAVQHPFPHMSKVDARVMANLGRDVVPTGDAIEDSLLKAAIQYANHDYCQAQAILLPTVSLARSLLDKSLVKTLSARLGKQCQLDQVDKTFNTFCQVGQKGYFPIAAALRQQPPARMVAQHERMFWTRIWVGDCRGAALAMRQILLKLPRGIMQRRGYLRRRMEYMRSRLNICRPTPGLYCTPEARQLMRSLVQKDVVTAEATWKKAYAAKQKDPLAKIWRTAIMLTLYPQSIYSPCTGNSLLSGDSATDALIFDRVSILKHGKPVSPCWMPDREAKIQCLVTWMKAAFIAGKYDMVIAYAHKVENVAGHCNEGHQLVACVHLCGNGSVPQEACTALASYNRMCARSAALPHNRIGMGLAESICQGRREALLDPFYIRFGPSSRPLLRLFAHYFPGFIHAQQSAAISIKKLLCGKQSSILEALSLQSELGLLESEKSQAIWTAHKTLCPCLEMTDQVKKKLLEEHVKVHNQTKELSTLSKSLAACPCQCPCPCENSSETLSKDRLLNIRALQAAAQMYIQGHMKCPCLERGLIKKHKVASSSQRKKCTCCCSCPRDSAAPSPHVPQKTTKEQQKALEEQRMTILNRIREQKRQQVLKRQLKEAQRIKQLQQEHEKLQKRLIKERHRLQQLKMRTMDKVPGLRSLPPHQMQHVACHLNLHCPCHCTKMLMQRFPFLQRFMVQNKANMPCKQMSRQLRKVLCGMINQLEAGCEASFAQRGLLCSK